VCEPDIAETFASAMQQQTVQLTDEDLQKLYAWIDEIPLTRPKRNIGRDFSDGVLAAEVRAKLSLCRCASALLRSTTHHTSRVDWQLRHHLYCVLLALITACTPFVSSIFALAHWRCVKVVAHYFPRLVELHNYSAANSVAQKLYNWNTFNTKVLRRLAFQLTPADIEGLANCRSGETFTQRRAHPCCKR
jgi:CH-like domain in sperm protein